MATYRKAEKGWYALRYEVLMRDNFTCQYCGQHAPNVRLEVDHIVPVVEGGTDDPSNLVTSCYACNRGKEGLRTSMSVTAQQTAAREGAVVVTLGDRLVQLLREHGAMSVKDIAVAMGKSSGHVAVLLNALQDKGRVVRVARGVWELAQDDAASAE